jgi:hypothetical protein
VSLLALLVLLSPSCASRLDPSFASDGRWPAAGVRWRSQIGRYISFLYASLNPAEYFDDDAPGWVLIVQASRVPFLIGNVPDAPDAASFRLCVAWYHHLACLVHMSPVYFRHNIVRPWLPFTALGSFLLPLIPYPNSPINRAPPAVVPSSRLMGFLGPHDHSVSFALFVGNLIGTTLSVDAVGIAG